jgi:hypothetical protein
MASTIAKNTVSNRDHAVKSGVLAAVETSSSLNCCWVGGWAGVAVGWVGVAVGWVAVGWVAVGVDHHQRLADTHSRQPHSIACLGFGVDMRVSRKSLSSLRV